MSIILKTIGLVVADMGKTLQFYRTLGLLLPENLDKESNVDFEVPGGLIMGFLAEETARQADPNFIKPVGQSMNLQFLADSAEEVDRIYNQLINAGYESYAEPWDAFWGQRFGRVKDPDGRIVNIYAHI